MLNLAIHQLHFQFSIYFPYHYQKDPVLKEYHEPGPQFSLPNSANWLVISVCNPCTIVIRDIMAVTPMMMPRVVRNERILLLEIFCHDILMLSINIFHYPFNQISVSIFTMRRACFAILESWVIAIIVCPSLFNSSKASSPVCPSFDPMLRWVHQQAASRMIGKSPCYCHTLLLSLKLCWFMIHFIFQTYFDKQFFCPFAPFGR